MMQLGFFLVFFSVCIIFLRVSSAWKTYFLFNIYNNFQHSVYETRLKYIKYLRKPSRNKSSLHNSNCPSLWFYLDLLTSTFLSWTSSYLLSIYVFSKVALLLHHAGVYIYCWDGLPCFLITWIHIFTISFSPSFKNNLTLLSLSYYAWPKLKESRQD